MLEVLKVLVDDGLALLTSALLVECLRDLLTDAQVSILIEE